MIDAPIETKYIEQRLKALREHGLEYNLRKDWWEPKKHTTETLWHLEVFRGINLFQNGMPSGHLKLFRQGFEFAYIGSIDETLLVSAEDEIFNRLPSRFLQPDILEIGYHKSHYSMLEELKQRRIPHGKIFTELKDFRDKI